MNKVTVISFILISVYIFFWLATDDTPPLGRTLIYLIQELYIVVQSERDKRKIYRRLKFTLMNRQQIYEYKFIFALLYHLYRRKQKICAFGYNIMSVNKSDNTQFLTKTKLKRSVSKRLHFPDRRRLTRCHSCRGGVELEPNDAFSA